MAWTLLARAADRSVAGTLTAYELKLTLRLNEVGSFELAVPREATPARWPAAGAGLIAIRDGQVVASGNIDAETYAWSADPTDNAAGPGVWSLTGDTDLARLAYRIVYPTPSKAWAGQTDGYFTFPFDGSRTNAEEVIRVAVNWQAGSLALAERRVPGLRLGSPTGAGKPVRMSERFTPLLDALRKVARAGGGLVFDVTDTLDGHVEFTVRAPLDRTSTARFGVELGNLRSLQVSRDSPSATTALVAGQGRGADRELVEYPDPDADKGWGRREQFVDQRQVDASLDGNRRYEEYAKAADAMFSDQAETTSIAAVITDTATTRWGRDYNLGDKVAVLTPYGPIQDLIRQVDITVAADGAEDISCVIGHPDPATADPLAEVARRLAQRVAQLEHAS